MVRRIIIIRGARRDAFTTQMCDGITYGIVFAHTLFHMLLMFTYSIYNRFATDTRLYVIHSTTQTHTHTNLRRMARHFRHRQ